jgi:hypothetical protein
VILFSISIPIQSITTLCRVVPIAIGNAQAESLSHYDKEKYKAYGIDIVNICAGG